MFKFAPPFVDWWGNSPWGYRYGVWQEPVGGINPKQAAKWGIIFFALYCLHTSFFTVMIVTGSLDLKCTGDCCLLLTVGQ